MRIIIIGGVAGGAGVAARLRRLSEDIEIIMFERGRDISFANCGIPYYIGDVIKDRNVMNVITEDSFHTLFKIDVRTSSEVIKIDRENKQVVVKHSGKYYNESYDKLILSPGAEPINPFDKAVNTFTVRNLEDMDTIKDYITQKKPKNAVVIGGGFIGIEMAENLHHLGMQVSVVELAGHIMNHLDYEMASFIHRELRNKNIGIYLDSKVQSFLHDPVKVSSNPNACIIKVKLDNGQELDADLVVISIGVKPEIKLAQEAGLKLGEYGGIVVNEYLETNDSDIYALGDATEIKNIITERQSLVPLANVVNKQARFVADNILGYKRTYKGTPITAIVKVFDYRKIDLN
ncbi:MAG: FAD-dependent oxidoreductase [bacterium]|nr:FAD-dependent oxidoreductase [bacterium]